MIQKIKRFQLWTHRYYSEIRLWLIVFIAFLVLGFSIFSISNQNKLIRQVNTLSIQNKILSEQNKSLNTQTRNLSAQNQSIAKQNRSYINCGFQLFAKYTRDGLPITIKSLDTCTTVSQTVNTNDSPTAGTTPAQAKAAADSANSAPTPAAQPTQTTQIVPTQPERPVTPAAPSGRKLLNCNIDVLFVHVGC